MYLNLFEVYSKVYLGTFDFLSVLGMRIDEAIEDEVAGC